LTDDNDDDESTAERLYDISRRNLTQIRTMLINELRETEMIIGRKKKEKKFYFAHSLSARD